MFLKRPPSLSHSKKDTGEVRLGRGGGQTIFDMVTYNGTAMKIVRDERYGFDEGFRLPGALEILEKCAAACKGPSESARGNLSKECTAQRSGTWMARKSTAFRWTP